MILESIFVTFHDVILRSFGSDSDPGIIERPSTLESNIVKLDTTYMSLLNYIKTNPWLLIDEIEAVNYNGTLAFKVLFETFLGTLKKANYCVATEVVEFWEVLFYSVVWLFSI